MTLGSRAPLKRIKRTPEHHSSPSKAISRSIAIGASISALACLLTDGAEAHDVPVKEWVADMAYFRLGQSSDTERSIGRALETSLGKRVVVRCTELSSGQQKYTVKYDGRSVAYATLNPSDTRPLVRIDKDICKQAVQAKDMEDVPSQDKLSLTAHAVAAITLTGLQIHSDETNPDAFKCYTLQKTSAVAEGLGADQGAAHELGRIIAEPYQQSERQIHDCHLNGPLDTTNGQSPYLPLAPASK